MTAWVFLDDNGNVTGGNDYTAEKPVPKGAKEIPPGERAADYVGKRWTGEEWVPAQVGDLEPESPEVQAKARKEVQAKQDALAYLAETDWLVTRFAETGKPIPADVAKKRKAARETISPSDGETK